jgi:hypothetical protein
MTLGQRIKDVWSSQLSPWYLVRGAPETKRDLLHQMRVEGESRHVAISAGVDDGPTGLDYVVRARSDAGSDTVEAYRMFLFPLPGPVVANGDSERSFNDATRAARYLVSAAESNVQTEIDGLDVAVADACWYGREGYPATVNGEPVRAMYRALKRKRGVVSDVRDAYMGSFDQTMSLYRQLHDVSPNVVPSLTEGDVYAALAGDSFH